ncbi:hypothetical protein NSTC731_05464 [Nostoc sp. DSM 114167]|jgi:hypothetical protein
MLGLGEEVGVRASAGASSLRDTTRVRLNAQKARLPQQDRGRGLSMADRIYSVCIT